jgi:hypothetical protein
VRTDEWLSDLWWLCPRGRRHAYTCPLLMTLSMWLYRLRAKRARWKMCYYSDGSACARALIGHAEIHCLFPRWLVLAECDFWNSRPGLRIRSRGAHPCRR